MSYTFAHYNFNVADLERSLRFYDEALGLKPVRRKEAEGFGVSRAKYEYEDLARIARARGCSLRTVRDTLP